MTIFLICISFESYKCHIMMELISVNKFILLKVVTVKNVCYVTIDFLMIDFSFKILFVMVFMI